MQWLVAGGLQCLTMERRSGRRGAKWLIRMQIFKFLSVDGTDPVSDPPFGVDYTGWTITDAPPTVHTENYLLISPMDREIARLTFEGQLKTAVEEEGAAQSILAKWKTLI